MKISIACTKTKKKKTVGRVLVDGKEKERDTREGDRKQEQYPKN